MSGTDRKDEPHGLAHGPVRKLLRLIVEADSSRSFTTRMGATLVILGALALFGLGGYGLAALVSRWLG